MITLHNPMHAAYFVLLTTSVFLLCDMPDDPGEPKNTKISAIFKTADSTLHEHSVVDTAGRVLTIGAALRLPVYFDSVKLEIKSDENILLYTETFRQFDSGTYNDTVWVTYSFDSSGVKFAVLTPYTALGLVPVIANITIIQPKDVPVNHRPEITVTGNTVVRPGETCRLTLRMTDPDPGQTLTPAMSGQPSGATLVGTTFIWNTPSDFIGASAIEFIVADNMYPQMRDTENIMITVTATPHPPVIAVTGNFSLKPLETCTLEIKTGDEDTGQRLTVTMTGNPAGSAIVNDSLFVWTAPAAAPEIHAVTFTVTDNGLPPLSSTASVVINVAANVIPDTNTPPKWNVDTLHHATNDTASYSLLLSGVCTDADKDLLLYTLLDGTPAGDAISDGSYTFKAASATVGTHLVHITAADPAGAMDTLVIILTVTQNAGTDDTPPAITLVAPAGETAVTASPSFTIDILCSDASGISSVIATLAGNGFPAAEVDGHYTVTVTGLQQGVDNTVVISVKDGSANNNEAIKTIIFSFTKTCTVTFDAQGGSAVTGQTVACDGTATPPAAPVRDGYAFGGWYRDKECTSQWNFTTGKVTADTTLFAKWVIGSFTVTFNAMGGSDIAVQTVEYDKPATAPATPPTRPGYDFGGWYRDEACSTAWDFTSNKISGDTTIYAKWDIASFPLVYDGNNNSGGSAPAAVTRPFNSEVTVAAFGNLAKTGHDIISWNTKKTSQETGVDYAPGDKFTMPAKEVTLYARWQVGEYKISYNANGGDGTAPVAQTVKYNTTVLLATQGNLQRDGYIFDGWNTNSSGTGATYAAGSSYTMGTADLLLYVKWKEICTVTFDSRSSTNIPSKNVIQGNTVADPGTPENSGYTFKGWFKEPQCRNAWTFSSDKVNTPMTLYAKWVVEDADGNLYDTVKIGDQVWMVQNMRTTKYNDESAISHLRDSIGWLNVDTAGYCWYGNVEANKNTYGALYTWNAVNTGKLAPIGWHVPSDEEWNILIATLGGSDVAGGKMKEAGTMHWNSPNEGATNSSGFTGLPGGERNGKYMSGVMEVGLSHDMGNAGTWWSTTVAVESVYMSYISLSFDNTSVYSNSFIANWGYSIRCVKDN